LARRGDFYLKHTTLSTNRRQCSRWDSKPQSKQASGRRPTSQTARPLGRRWNTESEKTEWKKSSLLRCKITWRSNLKCDIKGEKCDLVLWMKLAPVAFH